MAAFHAHQDGDFVICCSAANVGCCGRQCQVAWMRSDHFAHTVDQIESSFHRRGTCNLRRHPNREEKRIESTFAHTRDIDVPSLFLAAMLKVLSKSSRCVVSTWVSITIARSWICFALSEICGFKDDSTKTAPAKRKSSVRVSNICI